VDVTDNEFDLLRLRVENVRPMFSSEMMADPRWRLVMFETLEAWIATLKILDRAFHALEYHGSLEELDGLMDGLRRTVSFMEAAAVGNR
jgi:hypothetical protein